MGGHALFRSGGAWPRGDEGCRRPFEETGRLRSSAHHHGDGDIGGAGGRWMDEHLDLWDTRAEPRICGAPVLPTTRGEHGNSVAAGSLERDHERSISGCGFGPLYEGLGGVHGRKSLLGTGAV